MLLQVTLTLPLFQKKIDDLKALVTGMLDILIITETKFDNSFPISQFHIDGYSKPYRLGRNRNGGGIIIYVREVIPNSMLTKYNFPDNIEVLFIELNFRKSNWLIGGMYHPPSQPDQYYFNTPGKALDVYSNYENVLLIGDFNAQIKETYLDTFLYQHEVANINEEPTCYKNSENPSFIDFILSNRPKGFFKTKTVFTGLSFFHKLVLSIFKTTFLKSKPKELQDVDVDEDETVISDDQLMSGELYQHSLHLLNNIHLKYTVAMTTEARALLL